MLLIVFRYHGEELVLSCVAIDPLGKKKAPLFNQLAFGRPELKDPRLAPPPLCHRYPAHRGRVQFYPYTLPPLFFLMSNGSTVPHKR